jgi:hypothetical protein
MKRWVLFLTVLTITLSTRGQKNYASTSVLAKGKWIKIATEGQGVFKVTGSFLNQSGFASPISSAFIQLFGQDGRILPESNRFQAVDDLKEVHIEMVDGGDGLFDKDDYFLFYAPGANQWVFDTLTQSFQFVKNYYSDQSYYFIQVANERGLRLEEKIILGAPGITSQQYTEHLRSERDVFNFLNSGKEWYGDAFGVDQPATRSYQLVPSGAVIGSRFTLTSEVVGRSFDNPNKLLVSVNGKNLFQHTTAPVQGTFLEPIANVNQLSTEGIIESGTIALKYDFVPGSVNGQSWLNWFELICRRELNQYNDSFLSFRDPFVAASNQVVSYTLSASNPRLKIWEVTQFGEYAKMATEYIDNRYRFKGEGDKLREYISFDPQLAKQPVFIGGVVNQNLHGEGFWDMVIVAEPSMLNEAKRLAAFRETRDGIKVLVTDPMTIYNEFSAGSPDPSAIRNFLKMLYDRAGANPSNRPKYLLLFGGTSFNYKEREGDKKNLVPSYQSQSSLDPLTSYVSDDFFGYLDDGDDINTNIPAPMLDVAVGRIPARTIGQAKIAVDKIIAYQTTSDFGTWRNELTLVADDEDFDLHFNDAESHAAIVEKDKTVWDLNKIYLDAYKQVSGTGGSRYPDVNTSITKSINKGTLLWNYSGHGGNARLAQEAVLEKEMIQSWENQKRLPLFVTATCDFAPFDNPAQFSIGEELFVGRSNGAIGLMTTTRLVFASSNKLMNNNFLQSLLQKNAQGKYPTLGEAWLDAKNKTVLSAGDYINARKFAMLGDPSMKLLMPEYQVRTTKVVDLQTSLVVDTMLALNAYQLVGEILTPEGFSARDFNGSIYVRIYDKASNSQTLGNDPQSSVRNFKVYDNLIYAGKALVEAGSFKLDFIVPNDIRFEYGAARISYYAEDGIRDAQGIDQSLVIGGFGGQAPNDKEGPRMQAFLNNEQFRNGATVNQSPLLMLNLSDKSGIYLGRFGIGHDIRMVIDEDYSNPIVLNEYFKPIVNANKAGEVRYRLPELPEGPHKLELKAWDVFNNSSVLSIDFSVGVQKKVLVKKMFNFPNPVYGSTTFSFDVEGPTGGASLQLDIFTIDGKSISTIKETINQASLRSIQLVWNGLDKSGKKPQSGVYFARVSIKSRSGEIETKLHKLILL